MDKIEFTILKDGTITVKTSDISAGNHMSADKLMEQFNELMGGKVDIKKNPDAHRYLYKHNVAHQH